MVCRTVIVHTVLWLFLVSYFPPHLYVGKRCTFWNLEYIYIFLKFLKFPIMIRWVFQKLEPNPLPQPLLKSENNIFPKSKSTRVSTSSKNGYHQKENLSSVLQSILSVWDTLYYKIIWMGPAASCRKHYMIRSVFFIGSDFSCMRH